MFSKVVCYIKTAVVFAEQGTHGSRILIMSPPNLAPNGLIHSVSSETTMLASVELNPLPS